MTPLHSLVKSGSTFEWNTFEDLETRQGYMDKWEKSVRLFVNQFPGAIEGVDVIGRLPLHIAAAGKATPFWLVDLMISKYPAGLNVYDGSGRLPYFIAATSDAPLDVMNALVQWKPSNLLGLDPFGVVKFMVANPGAIPPPSASKNANARAHSLIWA
jgi:hypothetical protein